MIETLLSVTGLIILAIGIALGFGIGCVWYRGKIRNDPALLERLAADFKSRGDRVKDRFS